MRGRQGRRQGFRRQKRLCLFGNFGYFEAFVTTAPTRFFDDFKSLAAGFVKSEHADMGGKRGQALLLFRAPSILKYAVSSILCIVFPEQYSTISSILACFLCPRKSDFPCPRKLRLSAKCRRDRVSSAKKAWRFQFAICQGGAASFGFI